MSKNLKILRNKDGQVVLKTVSDFDLIIGSIPDVFAVQPDTSNYLDLISSLNNGQRMFNAWQRTGNQMKYALSKYRVENDKKKSKIAHSN